jgi:alpha-glucosidase
MPWDGSTHAGFSMAESWLPLGDDSAYRNVESELADESSLLNLYRALLALRRAHPALALGAYRPLTQLGDVLAYQRTGEDERILVVLNLGPELIEYPIETVGYIGKILLSTASDRGGEAVSSPLILRPYEGIIILSDS